MLLLPLLLLAAGIVFVFSRTTAEEPVSRAQVPTVDPGPAAPSATGNANAGRENAGRENAGRENAGRGNAGRESSGGGNASRGGGTSPAAEAGLTSGERGPLRDRLARITQDYPGLYGVVVSDPSTGQTVAMDPDQRFLAASINKLPVLMTLYKAAAAGTVDLDDPITMRASDIQAYGTGSLQLEPVGTTMTLRECAEYLIKESDNTAWKMLDRHMGRDYIRSELYNVGATSTEYWIPNTTTPRDVLLMLEKISDPSYTSPELSAEMLDLMTNTDFEDRLPRSLPDGARVAHKIGSYGTTFGDAGVVFPEGSGRKPGGTENAYFIVVLATETGEGTARAAMQEMSLATYQTMTRSRQRPDDESKQGP